MKKTTLTFLSLLFFVSATFSQKNDFAIWPGLKVSKNWTKRWMTDVYLQGRFNNNVSYASNVFVDVGVKYKISNHFRVSLDYVYVNHSTPRRQNNTGHQIYVEFAYKTQYRKFKFIYKLTGQTQYHNIYSSEGGKNSSNYIRNKVQVEYNLSKWIDPYVYCEPRVQIYQSGNLLYDRFRIGGGFHIKLNYQNQVDVYFMVQSRFNNNIPNKIYILGINYNISFY